MLRLNTFGCTGIDNVVEGTFANVVFRPDKASQYLAVAQAGMAMFIVNGHNVGHTIDIRQTWYFLTIFLHTQLKDNLLKRNANI